MMSGTSAIDGSIIAVNAASAAAIPPVVELPLVHDQDLSVYWAGIQLGPTLDHSHKRLEVVLLFEPAVCTVSWPSAKGRQSERLVSPAVAFIAPRQLHACAWEKSADVVLIRLEHRLRRRLLPRGLSEPVMAPPGLGHDGVLWQLAGGLRGLCRRENASNIPFLAMVAQCVVARAIELIDARPAPALRRLSDVQLQTVQELVRVQLAYEIFAEDMAKSVGLSLQYFNALFKNTVGVTPAEYLHECRMQKAKELLSTGRHKIGAAARLVGFWDAGYFTARFRAHFGVSPRTMIAQARAISSVRPCFSSERP